MKRLARTLALAIFTIPVALCQESRPVAVVLSLTGSATANGKLLHELDWIEANAHIQVKPKSALSIVFENGRCFELEGGARGTSQPNGLTATSGPVREGKTLPPIPKPAPIKNVASSVSGAARFRNGAKDVRELYPHRASALPARVKLSFSPVEDATVYNIVITNSDGDAVLNMNTGGTVVNVSPDVLEPGARYLWRVRAMGAGGQLSSGDAEFVTLSRESAEQRAKFAEGIESLEPAMRLALMANVDLRLQLLAEACEEYEKALSLRPADVEIKRAAAIASEALSSARRTK